MTAFKCGCTEICGSVNIKKIFENVGKEMILCENVKIGKLIFFWMIFIYLKVFKHAENYCSQSFVFENNNFSNMLF